MQPNISNDYTRLVLTVKFLFGDDQVGHLEIRGKLAKALAHHRACAPRSPHLTTLMHLYAQAVADVYDNYYS
jgi:hypothetical protein